MLKASSYFILFFVVGITSLVRGQVKNKGIPFIENYTTAVSPAISQTWDILQDKRGVLYMANSFGLTEFDGLNWRSIKMKNNSIVRSMAMDQDGRIYVGAVDELGYLAFEENGTLRYQSLLDQLPQQDRNTAEIKDILISSQGVCFLGSHKLYVYDGKHFSVFSTKTSYESAFLIHDDLFVYERETGLLNIHNGKVTPVADGVGFATDHVRAMLPFKNQILTISRDQGCFLYDGKQFKKWPSSINQFLITNKVQSFLRLSNGFMVFGTTLDGILIVDQNLQPMQHLNKSKGLIDNKIHAICQDNSGNLWIGHDVGVSHVETSSPFTYYNEKLVLGMGYAARQFNNRLYLGTSQGLFVSNWQEYHNPLTESERFEPVNNAAGLIWNLSQLNNSLLLGHEEGAYQVVNNQATSISPRIGSWNFMDLKANPDYVISGTYTGFNLYQKQNNTFVYVRKLGGFKESCRIVEQEDDGTIWVAHGYKGLYKMNINDSLTQLVNIKFYGAQHGFPSNLGINVYKVRNETLFTSEAGGIFKYDPANDRFVKYRRFEEWLGPSPALSRLYEDSFGNIWFAGAKRMGYLLKLPNDTYRLEEKLFNKVKESIIHGFESITPIDEKNVYIGTTEGFIHFNPQIAKDVETPFRTLIRKVELTGERDSTVFNGAFAEASGILSMAQSGTQVLEIPYQSNALRVSFAAAYYEDRAKIRYSYFLEGFDANWSEWTTKTEREYTNLPEGPYTLHIKALNIYDKESIPATYQFVILPPFSRSPLAYLCYAVSALALMAFVAHTYAKRKAKTLLVKQQLSEEEIIRLKNQQLQTELEHKNNELGSLTMHIVSKNDILATLKEKLLSIQKNADTETNRQIARLLVSIDKETDLEKDWPYFELHFDKVHKDFLQILKEKFPHLKSTELMLCAYVRMNLSNKEIASLMNNTVRGVEAHRYRLRKSLGLHAEDNLKEYLFNLTIHTNPMEPS